jgi:hypothetical protein
MATTKFNEHEQRARERKALVLVGYLRGRGMTSEQLLRTTDAQRAEIARNAGTRPPSHITWAAVVGCLEKCEEWDRTHGDVFGLFPNAN